MHVKVSGGSGGPRRRLRATMRPMGSMGPMEQRAALEDGAPVLVSRELAETDESFRPHRKHTESMFDPALQRRYSVGCRSAGRSRNSWPRLCVFTLSVDVHCLYSLISGLPLLRDLEKRPIAVNLCCRPELPICWHCIWSRCTGFLSARRI